jgi:isoleucyl-tRNA synthetase
VLGQLEGMRSNKEIGKSLEAELNLQNELNARYDPAKANASTLTLKKYENSLAELFGLSRVSVRPVAELHESIAQFAEGHPQKATGTKCERCWRYTDDVGKQEKYPTVCHRCAEALDAIDFPPYATNV